MIYEHTKDRHRCKNRKIKFEKNDNHHILENFLDSNLTWNQQFNKIVQKSEITFMGIRGVHGKTWETKPAMIHWLYIRVVLLAIQYGSLAQNSNLAASNVWRVWSQGQ